MKKKTECSKLSDLIDKDPSDDTLSNTSRVLIACAIQYKSDRLLGAEYLTRSEVEALTGLHERQVQEAMKWLRKKGQVKAIDLGCNRLAYAYDEKYKAKKRMYRKKNNGDIGPTLGLINRPQEKIAALKRLYGSTMGRDRDLMLGIITDYQKACGDGQT